MEAYGPLTRRGNVLVPDSRTSFDRPESAHNVSAKPAAATTHGSNAAAITHGGRALTSASTAAVNFAPTPDGTALIGRDTPRVMERLLTGRGSLLKDIVSLIGIDRAARLIAAFGGMRLYVPQAPEPNDTLSELIGFDAACALARIYGGDRIDVPNPTPRGIQILALRASGVSIDGIARALHCTRRRVFQVLAEARRKQRLRKVPQLP